MFSCSSYVFLQTHFMCSIDVILWFISSDKPTHNSFWNRFFFSLGSFARSNSVGILWFSRVFRQWKLTNNCPLEIYFYILLLKIWKWFSNGKELFRMKWEKKQIEKRALRSINNNRPFDWRWHSTRHEMILNKRINVLICWLVNEFPLGCAAHHQPTQVNWSRRNEMNKLLARKMMKKKKDTKSSKRNSVKVWFMARRTFTSHNRIICLCISRAMLLLLFTLILCKHFYYIFLGHFFPFHFSCHCTLFSTSTSYCSCSSSL